VITAWVRAYVYQQQSGAPYGRQEAFFQVREL
jgi:hypothetical protein